MATAAQAIALQEQEQTYGFDLGQRKEPPPERQEPLWETTIPQRPDCNRQAIRLTDNSLLRVFGEYERDEVLELIRRLSILADMLQEE